MSDGRNALVDELNDLAGGWGAPAAVQYSIDHLPGSSTSNVGYDFSVSLGLLLGDLAAVIETASGDPQEVGGAPGPDDTPPAAGPGGAEA